MRLWPIVPMLALLLTLATAGNATPGQDLVTRSLQEQGFEVRLVHWTLLGRIRIIAVSDSIRREIVINPTTGEILRDYSQAIVAVVPETNSHDRSNDQTPAATARVAGDVDASAVSALEAMSMGLAAPLVADQVQP
jgi:hypothetical protein